MYSPWLGLTFLLAIFVNCSTASNPITNVCVTDTCKKESSKLKSYMDLTVDPCQNFYDFACGTYIKTGELPKERHFYISMLESDVKLSQRMNDTLSGEFKSNELHASKLAKDFFDTCMDTATLNAAGIEPMAKLLEKYGGWPVTAKQWIETGWDWLKVKQQTLDDGFLMMGELFEDRTELILGFEIRPDEKNSLKRSIFVSRKMDDSELKCLVKNLSEIFFFKSAQIEHPQFGLEEDFLRMGIDNKNVKIYYNFMVDLAVKFGAEQSVAERDMRDAVEFEIQLAKVSISIVHSNLN